MARIGLAVDSLQISSIDDRGVGYIAALAAPHQAEQRAAQAGPLAAAQAMQDVLVEQARVAQRNADLRQAQLIAEVVKPAEAEAEALRTLAKARADAVKLSAEAAAHGRIALDQKVIEQLPDMLRAAGCSRRTRRRWTPSPARSPGADRGNGQPRSSTRR